MASIRAQGWTVPFTLPLGDDGRVLVEEQLLSAKFNFRIGTIYVEEEVYSDGGDLQETVLQMKLRDDDGGVWSLSSGRYKVFGLEDKLM